MSIEFLKSLPSPEEIKNEFPLDAELILKKQAFDAEIKDVFTGKSDKFIAVIGPCSADNEEAVLDYVGRLAKVQEQIKDRVIIIPRVYTNKPRTTGDGYKGMLHQPDPEKKPDLVAGIKAIRKLHLDVIRSTGFFPADEMLYPENWMYCDDTLSYVAIGARSVEDQQHRLTASGMDVPVGMKNPTAGGYDVMLNSVHAASNPHTFIYRGHEVHTSGNPLTHSVLRGAVNKKGQCVPNYHYEDLLLVNKMYVEHGLPYPAVIVDSNHSNSNKQYMEQIRIVEDVLHSRKMNADIKNLVKGVMVESYIEPGAQKIGEHIYGKSITDPCLGWASTEELLLKIAEQC